MAIPKGHKPDCQCPLCKRERAKATSEVQNGPVVSQADYDALESERERLSQDYAEALENNKKLRDDLGRIQKHVDSHDIRDAEQKTLIDRFRRQRDSMTEDYAHVVDLLRSAAVVYHRELRHRGTFDQCDDLVCRESNKAWFVIGRGPGLETAKEDPETWWMKKQRNEGFVENFGDPGPLEPEDVAEGLAEEEEPEEEEEIPEPVGISVDASELDELPDHPAFASGRARILTPSNVDRDQPPWPKKPRV